MYYGSDAAAKFLKSGVAGKYITVTCATRGACKIQNSMTGNHTVVELGGSYITFDGFEVANTSSASNNLGIYVTSQQNVNITHNAVHHIESNYRQKAVAVLLLQAANAKAAPATTYYSTPTGFMTSVGRVAETASVQTEGLPAETAGGGITIAAPMAVQNNLVFSNSLGGITLIGGTVTPMITNNIAVDNRIDSGRCGINVPVRLAVTYANNDLWNNAGGELLLRIGQQRPEHSFRRYICGPRTGVDIRQLASQ
jgi:hypothetical protein